MTKTIPLTRGMVALVDDEDFDWLSQWRWNANPVRSRLANFYAVRGQILNGVRKTVYMHRTILKPPAKFLTDHINHDGLDNRRSNLRICTPAQNLMNARTQNATGFRGVYVSPENSQKYYATIDYAGRRYRLGRFSQPEEAARAYDAKARELFGDFATLNFPITRQPEKAA